MHAYTGWLCIVFSHLPNWSAAVCPPLRMFGCENFDLIDRIFGENCFCFFGVNGFLLQLLVCAICHFRLWIHKGNQFNCILIIIYKLSPHKDIQYSSASQSNYNSFTEPEINKITDTIIVHQKQIAVLCAASQCSIVFRCKTVLGSVEFPPGHWHPFGLFCSHFKFTKIYNKHSQYHSETIRNHTVQSKFS